MVIRSAHGGFSSVHFLRLHFYLQCAAKIYRSVAERVDVMVLNCCMVLKWLQLYIPVAELEMVNVWR